MGVSVKFKTMEKKWEELIPHIEQMKIWAGHPNVADGGHPANEKLVMSREKKAVLHKILKVAYEQVARISEGELKLLDENSNCLICGKSCEAFENDIINIGDWITYASQFSNRKSDNGKDSICNICYAEHQELCMGYKNDAPEIELL